MAAYAALVSLKHITDDIEYHPSPPISIDKKQVLSLMKNVTFLLEFLEGYKSPFEYSDEADPLEIRIADATHAAEDVIESYIVDTIHLGPPTAHDHDNDDDGNDDGYYYYDSDDDYYDVDVDAAAAYIDDDDNDDVAMSQTKETRCIDFYKGLQIVIEEMDLIKKETMAMNREKAAAAVVTQQPRNISADAGLISTSNLMVGFEDVLLQLLDRLIGRDDKCEIIPIVGMGGIGKTTLARGAFEHRLIKEHFDICVWTTISQNYNIEETLRQVLSDARGDSSSTSEKDLVVELHKYLWGRRYLVILDDMWSIDVWDKLKFSFPNCSDGSRIIITTRMSNVAAHLTDSNNLLKMKFLDEVSSWNLFSKTVFGEQSFPTQLQKIGKKIVEKCDGLPLSISVIGGLMAESEPTQEYWEHIEKNLSSIVNSENDEYSLRILKMSYNYLPAYLKPCFLYMGVFEEDREISVSTIIRLWVSEGFLKQLSNKSLRTIAKEYLKELVDRNLILVHELGLNGKIRFCKIHDLLRDLCLKEAQKQRFFYVLREYSLPGEISQKRIVIPRSISKEKILDTLKFMPHARSYICHNHRFVHFPNSRCLKTLYTYDRKGGVIGWDREESQGNVFHLVNSQYLAFKAYKEFVVPSSINLLWNLHTLIIGCRNHSTAPIEIWKMHKLRHVEFTFGSYLPDPPSSDDDIVIMENLEVLKGVRNFNLNEDVVKRIPNIKKLYVGYDGGVIERVNCLNYLQCLSKLEYLWVSCETGTRGQYLHNISFPRSLKRLILHVTSYVELEDILQNIGWLPLLHKLIILNGVFITREWETTEGQFPRCRDLDIWTVSEHPHFPLLQVLHLGHLEELQEIPAKIGEISTLRSIELENCNESVVLSAKQILEEQEDLYGDQLDLHVYVEVGKEGEALQRLASSNFQVKVYDL